MKYARVYHDLDGLNARFPRFPERSFVYRSALPARPGAGGRIILERGTVGGGDGSLGRHGAGRWTARNALAPEERRDRGFVFTLTHDPDPSRQAPPTFQGALRKLTRAGFNFLQRGEYFHNIYV
jgi:hypothetical protein